jgi:hypothetical protein
MMHDALGQTFGVGESDEQANTVLYGFRVQLTNESSLFTPSSFSMRSVAGAAVFVLGSVNILETWGG